MRITDFLLPLLAFLCCSFSVNAQTLDNHLVVSSWNTSSGEYHLRGVLGEAFVGTLISHTGHLRQGLLQPIQYQEPIEGCLDVEACNYNEDASVADDSCDYVSCLIGCTEPDACNFDPLVIADDGSCDYSCCPGPGCCDDEGMHWDEDQQICVTTLHGDLDFDLCVGLSDLLEFLAVFGQCADE